MNKKQEKLFWWFATLGSYSISLWVVYSILTDPHVTRFVLIHTLGMSLICYFTTSCLISVYDYESGLNKKNKKLKKDFKNGK
jgi:hypothetical protein